MSLHELLDKAGYDYCNYLFFIDVKEGKYRSLTSCGHGCNEMIEFIENHIKQNNLNTPTLYITPVIMLQKFNPKKSDIHKFTPFNVTYDANFNKAKFLELIQEPIFNDKTCLDFSSALKLLLQSKLDPKNTESYDYNFMKNVR